MFIDDFEFWIFTIKRSLKKKKNLDDPWFTLMLYKKKQKTLGAGIYFKYATSTGRLSFNMTHGAKGKKLVADNWQNQHDYQ